MSIKYMLLAMQSTSFEHQGIFSVGAAIKLKFCWHGQVPIRDFATPELLPPSIATAEEVEEKAKHFLRQLGGRCGEDVGDVKWRE